MIRFACLLLLSPLFCHAQLDSLLQELSNREKTTETVDWLTTTAASIRETDPEGMQNLSERAVKMSRDLKYELGEGTSLMYLGMSFWERDLYVEAIDYYFKALEIFERLELKDKVARVKMNIGNTYDELGQTDKAKAFANEAISVLREVGDSTAIVKGILNLGVIHFYQEDYDSAERSFQEVLRFRLAAKDTSGIAISYLNLANVYEYQKNLGKAVEHYRLAKEVVAPDNTLKVNIDLGLGNALLLIGKEEEGLELIQEAILDAQRLDQRKMEQFGYEALKDYFVEQSEFEQAYSYFLKEVELDREFRGEEVQKKIEVINLKYEDEKKARELQEMENARAADTARNNLIYVLSAFVFFLLAAIILALRLRVKNSKLKEQELLLRIDSQNKELASYTLNFIQKNELLSELSDRVKELKTEASQKMSTGLTQLNVLINSHLRIDQDWENFKIMFEAVHEGFLVRLNEEYPDLSSADIKLCALIRLNLNLKESSKILGISSDSVKTARSRLRKKLQLDSSVNLYDFLLRFDGLVVHRSA